MPAKKPATGMSNAKKARGVQAFGFGREAPKKFLIDDPGGPC